MVLIRRSHEQGVNYRLSRTAVLAMWEEVVSLVPDPAVLRRLLFAAVQIPKSTPHYSDIVTDFAF